MSDRDNVLIQAIELATQERKYQDDKVIQSILSNFNLKLRSFQISHGPSYYDPISPYLDGLAGQSGCALQLGQDTITKMVVGPVNRLIDIAVIQAIAEQLILALNALGEELDY